MASTNKDIKERIEKDIKKFYISLNEEKAKAITNRGEKEREVVKLSEMYASDAKSYLEKGDFYTAFSCISYAHGLLDALKSVI